MPITAPVAITTTACAVVAGPVGIAIAESAAVTPAVIATAAGPDHDSRRSRRATRCGPAIRPGGVDAAIRYLPRAGRGDNPRGREDPGRGRTAQWLPGPVSHVDRPRGRAPRRLR